MSCNLCPRSCKADRIKNLGFCSKPKFLEVSKVMLHYGEEPWIANNKASGAIFFAGCNLKCVYCQNYQISNGTGKQISVQTLISLFKQLEESGASNIDLITPTHFANLIIDALNIYKPSIPVIYNCGGYETPEQIQHLSNFIDIFLFDLKYYSDKLAIKYSSAPNYFSYATNSILTALKNKPNVWINNQLVKGVIIRHLCLPSHTNDSKKILNWISKTDKSALVSIMSQYSPMYKSNMYPEINRTLKPLEYKIIINYAKKLDLKNVLVQELDSNTTELVPNFSTQDKQFKY